MAVLELGAVDLNYGARVLQQGLGGGFHDAGLTRSGGTQEQKIPDGASRRIHPGKMHLINIYNLLDSLVLPDNHATEAVLQLCSVSSSLSWIQRDIEPYHFVHRLPSRRNQPRLPLPQTLRQPKCHSFRCSQSCSDSLALSGFSASQGELPPGLPKYVPALKPAFVLFRLRLRARFSNPHRYRRLRILLRRCPA